MHSNKEQVRRFYDFIWNKHDKSAIADVLHENVSFRGSLGQQRQGHAGFAAYLDMVHAALGDYRCTIEELVAEGDKVFARMQFTGIHRGEFMGHPPTGRTVSWAGCALFTFESGRAVDVWVLGDLKSLEAQLTDRA